MQKKKEAKNSESKQIMVSFPIPGGEAHLEVRLENHAVWFTKEQMVRMYGEPLPQVTRAIANVYRAKELDEEQTSIEFQATESKRPVKVYHMDVAVAVGRRLKHQKTAFRVRAITRDVVLHELKRAHAEDFKKFTQMQTKRLRELECAVRLLQNVMVRHKLKQTQASELFAVIDEHARTWLFVDKDKKKVEGKEEVKEAPKEGRGESATLEAPKTLMALSVTRRANRRGKRAEEKDEGRGDDGE